MKNFAIIGTILGVLVILLSSCGIPGKPVGVTADLAVKPRYIRPVLPPGVPAIPTEDTSTPRPTKGKEFYSLGFSLNDEIGLPDRLGGVYWAAPDQPLAATFLFNNSTFNRRELTILCLVDYRQVPCLPKTETLSATVRSGERKEMRLEYPGLSAGMHQLTVVAVSYLPVPLDLARNRNKLGDLVFRSSQFAWPAELTVFVGSDTAPTLSQRVLDTAPPMKGLQGDLSFYTSTISDTTVGPPHPNLLKTEDVLGEPLRVQPGQPVRFYLLGGYTESAAYQQLAALYKLDQETLPFVVTAFLNDKQVPVSAELPNGPLFSSIPKGKSIVIPVTVTAPMEPGVYSYSVFFRPGPFIKQGELLPQADGGLLYKQLTRFRRLDRSEQVVFEVVP